MNLIQLFFRNLWIKWTSPWLKVVYFALVWFISVSFCFFFFSCKYGLYYSNGYVDGLRQQWGFHIAKYWLKLWDIPWASLILDFTTLRLRLYLVHIIDYVLRFERQHNLFLFCWIVKRKLGEQDRKREKRNVLVDESFFNYSKLSWHLVDCDYNEWCECHSLRPKQRSEWGRKCGLNVKVSESNEGVWLMLIWVGNIILLPLISCHASCLCEFASGKLYFIIIIGK